jgi:dihydrofolate reductase
MFEPSWSTRTVEEDPGAPFFNETTKYVVSGTLTDPTWRNSEVIGPYDPDRIRKLKDEVGDLYVSGSITLVRAMLADGLVDGLHLFVYPLTRGSGLPRLFPEDGAPTKFSLAASESYDNGVLYLNYRAQA